MTELLSPNRSSPLSSSSMSLRKNKEKTTLDTPSTMSRRVTFFELPTPRDDRLETMGQSLKVSMESMNKLRIELEKLSQAMINYLHAGKSVATNMLTLYTNVPAAIQSYATAHTRLFDIGTPLYTKTFTSELLIPLQDWFDDCEDLLFEFGNAQLNFIQTHNIQLELQNLYTQKLNLEIDQDQKSKIFNPIPKKINEIDRLISECKDRYNAGNFADEGLFRGIEKSFQYIMSTHSLLSRDILASLTSIEFRIMKENSSFAEAFRLAFEASLLEPTPVSVSSIAERRETLNSEFNITFSRTDVSLSKVDSEEFGSVSKRKYSYSDMRLKLTSDRRIETSRSMFESTISRNTNSHLDVYESSRNRAESPSEGRFESADECLTESSDIQRKESTGDNPTECKVREEPPVPSHLMSNPIPPKHCITPSISILKVPVPYIPITAVKGSIWENLLTTSSYLEPETDNLCSKFAIRKGCGKEDIEGVWARNRRSKRATWTSFSTTLKSVSSPTGIEYLEGIRKHEVEAGLTAISMTAEESAAALYNLDLRACRKRLKILQFIFPTEAESQYIRNAVGENDLKILSNASKFYYLVSQPTTPSFSERIECLSHMTAFESIFESLKLELSNILEAIFQVQESGSLRDVFAIILEFINFLNARDHIPEYGFSLTFLSQLQDIKTSERGVSLLDCIVAHISKYYNDLLQFSTSLSKLPEAIELDNAGLDHKLASLKLAVSITEDILKKDIIAHTPSDEHARTPHEIIDGVKEPEYHADTSSLTSPEDSMEPSNTSSNGTKSIPMDTPQNKFFDDLLPTQVSKWIGHAKDCIASIEELRVKLVHHSSSFCRWLCLDAFSSTPLDAIDSTAENSNDPSIQAIPITLDALRVLHKFVITFKRSVDALTLAAHEARLDSQRFVVNLKEEEEREEKEKILKFMKQFMLEEEAGTDVSLNSQGRIILSPSKRRTLPSPMISLKQAAVHPTFSRSQISVRRLPFSTHFTYSDI